MTGKAAELARRKPSNLTGSAACPFGGNRVNCHHQAANSAKWPFRLALARRMLHKGPTVPLSTPLYRRTAAGRLRFRTVATIGIRLR